MARQLDFEVPQEVPRSETRRVAAQIFILCFPLVLMDMIRRAHPLTINQFYLLANQGEILAPGLAEDDECVVVTSAWINLCENPVLLRLPATHGRFLSLTLIDTAGEAFASVGTRTRDDAGADLVLTGPRWVGEVPGHLTVCCAPSDGVWAVGRVHSRSAADHRETEAVARRQRLAVLRGEANPGGSEMLRLQPASSSCLQQVSNTSPAIFFHRIPGLLDRAPRAHAEAARPLLEAYAGQLGGPGEPSEWSPKYQRALALGLADGFAAVGAAAAAASDGAGPGWRMAGHGVEAAPSDALSRAARAFAGMGAPIRDDVLTLTCDRDETGRILLGAECYRIHVRADAAPPVHASWWLSIHPSRRGGLSGLGDRSDLALNPDGSLDLFIQESPPSVSKLSNWLPCPKGVFSLSMRLYWPCAAALSGAWRMPPVERLGSSALCARADNLSEPADG